MPTETPPETSLFARPIHQLVQLLVDSPDPVEHPPEDEELPVSETLKLLARERRRAIIRQLATTDQTPMTVSTLAERVACEEYDCDAESLAPAERKRVYVAAVQSHLPALVEANAIVYDSDEQLVDRGPEFARLWRTYTAVLDSLS